MTEVEGIGEETSTREAVESTEEALKSQVQSLYSFEGDIDALETALSELMRECNVKEYIISKMEEKNSIIKQNIQKEINNYSSETPMEQLTVEEQIKSLTLKLTALEAECANIHRKDSNVSSELLGIKNYLQNLDVVSTLNDEFRPAISDDSFTSEVFRNNELLDEYDNLEKLRSDILFGNRECCRLESELMKIKLAKLTEVEELQRLQLKKSNITQDHYLTLQKMEKAIHMTKMGLSASLSYKERLKEEIEKYPAYMVDLRVLYDKNLKEEDDIKKKIEDMIRHRDLLNENMKVHLDEKNRFYEQNRTKIQKFKTEYNTKQAELINLRSQVNKVKLDTVKEEQRLARYNEKHSYISKECNILENELFACEMEKASIDNKFDSLKDVIKEKCKEFDSDKLLHSKYVELYHRYNKKIIKLKEEYAALEEPVYPNNQVEFSDFRTDHPILPVYGDLQKQKLQNKTIKKQIEKLKDSLTNMTNEKKSIKNKIKKLKTESVGKLQDQVIEKNNAHRFNINYKLNNAISFSSIKRQIEQLHISNEERKSRIRKKNIVLKSINIGYDLEKCYIDNVLVKRENFPSENYVKSMKKILSDSILRVCRAEKFLSEIELMTKRLMVARNRTVISTLLHRWLLSLEHLTPKN